MTTNGKAPGTVESADGRWSIPFLLVRELPGPAALVPGEIVLAAMGLSIDGVPRFLVHESVADADEAAWRRFLIPLRDRSQCRPLLICCDGHPAMLKTIRATYPDIPVQLSVVHCLTALARSAVRNLETDIASCLNFYRYRFPRSLWRHIRKVNLGRREFQAARKPSLIGTTKAINDLAALDAAAHAARVEMAASVGERYQVASASQEDATPPVADASTVLLGVRS